MSEVTLLVKGMTCGGCKKSVENSITALGGVEKVDVELETGKVEVSFNDSLVNVEQIKTVVKDKGYFVEA